MINVDFKILVFISAARHLNFTRAAKEMNISQPAVSKNIQELESQAGHSLFTRSGHSLILTNAGKLFLEHAMRVRAAYGELNCELDMLDGVLSGELRLGASTTIAHFILPEIVAAFHLAYPDIRLKVYHGNSRKIEDLIADKTIDLGFVEGLSDNQCMKYETFVKDEVVLVTRKGNPKVAVGKSILPKRLLDFEYVFREQGSGTNDILRKSFPQIGIDDQHLYSKVYLSSTESIKNFLLKTDCFSFLSIHAVSKELQSGELEMVEVEEFRLERNFYFVHPHGVVGHLPKAFRKFCYERFVKNGLFYSGEPQHN